MRVSFRIRTSATNKEKRLERVYGGKGDEEWDEITASDPLHSARRFSSKLASSAVQLSLSRALCLGFEVAGREITSTHTTLCLRRLCLATSVGLRRSQRAAKAPTITPNPLPLAHDDITVGRLAAPSGLFLIVVDDKDGWSDGGSPLQPTCDN
jgi:hypothetical protein